MSIRWMAVQYVGDTLRVPIATKNDIDQPFGSSVLKREVKRIVINPFSDSSKTFVPEEKVVKLRELVQYICDENYGDDWFVEEAAALGINAHY